MTMDSVEGKKVKKDGHKRSSLRPHSKLPGQVLFNENRLSCKACEDVSRSAFQSSEPCHSSGEPCNQHKHKKDDSHCKKILVERKLSNSEHLKKQPGNAKQKNLHKENMAHIEGTDHVETGNCNESKQVHQMKASLRDKTKHNISHGTELCDSCQHEDDEWPQIKSRPVNPHECYSAAETRNAAESYPDLTELAEYTKAVADHLTHTLASSPVKGSNISPDSSVSMLDGDKNRFYSETDSESQSGHCQNMEKDGCFNDSVHTKAGSCLRPALSQFQSLSEGVESSDYHQKGKYWTKSDINLPSIRVLNVNRQPYSSSNSYPTESTPTSYNHCPAEPKPETDLPTSSGYTPPLAYIHKCDAARKPTSSYKAWTNTESKQTIKREHEKHKPCWYKEGELSEESFKADSSQAGNYLEEKTISDQQNYSPESSFNRMFLETSSETQNTANDDVRVIFSPEKDKKLQQKNHQRENKKQNFITLSKFPSPWLRWSREEISETNRKDDDSSFTTHDQTRCEKSERASQKVHEILQKRQAQGKEQNCKIQKGTEDTVRQKALHKKEVSEKLGKTNVKYNRQAETLDSLDSRSRYLLDQLKMVQITKKKASTLLRNVQNIIDKSQKSSCENKRRKSRTTERSDESASPRRHSSSTAVKESKAGPHQDKSNQTSPTKEPKLHSQETVDDDDRNLLQSLAGILDKFSRTQPKKRGDEVNRYTSGKKELKTCSHGSEVQESSKITQATENAETNIQQKISLSPHTQNRRIRNQRWESQFHRNKPDLKKFPLTITDKTHNSPKYDNFQDEELPESVLQNCRPCKTFLDSISLASDSTNCICTYNFRNVSERSPRRIEKRRHPTSEPRKIGDSSILNDGLSPEILTYKNTLALQKRRKMKKMSMKDSLKAAITVAKESISAAAKAAEALNFVVMTGSDSAPSLEEEIFEKFPAGHRHISPPFKARCVDNVIETRESRHLKSDCPPKRSSKLQQAGHQRTMNTPCPCEGKYQAISGRSKHASPVQLRPQNDILVKKRPVCHSFRKDLFPMTTRHTHCKECHKTDSTKKLTTNTVSAMPPENTSQVLNDSLKAGNCIQDKENIVITAIPDQTNKAGSPLLTVQIVYTKPHETQQQPEVNCLIECSFQRKAAEDAGHKDANKEELQDIKTFYFPEKRNEPQSRRASRRSNQCLSAKQSYAKKYIEYQQQPKSFSTEKSPNYVYACRSNSNSSQVHQWRDPKLDGFILPGRNTFNRQIIYPFMNLTLTDSAISNDAAAKKDANFNRSTLEFSSSAGLGLFHNQEEIRLERFGTSQVTKEQNVSHITDLVMFWQQNVVIQQENGGFSRESDHLDNDGSSEYQNPRSCTNESECSQNMDNPRFSSEYQNPSSCTNESECSQNVDNARLSPEYRILSSFTNQSGCSQNVGNARLSPEYRVLSSCTNESECSQNVDNARLSPEYRILSSCTNESDCSQDVDNERFSPEYRIHSSISSESDCLKNTDNAGFSPEYHNPSLSACWHKHSEQECPRGFAGLEKWQPCCLNSEMGFAERSCHLQSSSERQQSPKLVAALCYCDTNSPPTFSEDICHRWSPSFDLCHSKQQTGET